MPRTTSSWPSSPSSGRSTAATSTPPGSSAGSPRAASACCRGRARTREWSTSVRESRSRSRSSRTTTPRAVEPFQGAATGVGGILRDIVAMGARPVALLDGLCVSAGPTGTFAGRSVASPITGTVLGSPTVGGETVFDDAYTANPLVNAMCVGLLPAERVLRARATGPGNAIVLYGALTGRDGIGGASVLASQDLEGSDEKRPSVQIGDPFRGKALIEVSLDLVERDLVVGLQDCGAAGLASSLAEMASGGAGVDVHLDRVPLREPGLEPWEIMISESQERMVAVVEPGRLDEVRAACDRWELPCTVIGEVTGHGELRAFFEGRARRRDSGAASDRGDSAVRARARGASSGRSAGARSGQRRAEDLGVRAVRPARRLAHRAPPRPRRRRAAARRDARSRGLARRAAGRGARPLPRRPPGRARRRAQRRLRRR